jgi:hypothetical protein
MWICVGRMRREHLLTNKRVSREKYTSELYVNLENHTLPNISKLHLLILIPEDYITLHYIECFS